MFRWKKDQDLRDQAEEYASHYDFREIFTEDEAGLRLLAFLLTGDRARAEQCLVPGLNQDDQPADNPAFHDWAHSWSKRAIIKNAIQVVGPSALSANGHVRQNSGRTPTTLAGAVSCLSAFERFVFIMTLVEGYSVHECAELLGAASHEVTLAKSQAVDHVASLLPAEENVQSINPVLREKTA